MMTYNEFVDVNEKKKAKPAEYSYGCAMVYFDFPEIKEVHKLIDKDDLYEDDTTRYGLEKSSHCTLLYGLHSDEIEDQTVMDICNSIDIGTVKIYKASIFENEKYDVVKFDVKNKNLNKLNKKLCKLPFTTDFPDYHPHMTIAYVKSGKGAEIVKKMKDLEYEVNPNEIVYSKPDKTKVKNKIEIKKETE